MEETSSVNKILIVKALLAGVGLVLIAVALYFSVLWFMSNRLKGDVYQQSLSYVNRDEAIAEYIGVPVSPGVFVSGELNETEMDGRTNIKYYISGNKGSGEVNVYAYKEEGVWKLFEIVVNCHEPKERLHVYSPHWKPRHNEKLLNPLPQ